MTIQSYKISLAIGYTLVTGAVFYAWRTPATGYELSIYANTPLFFWIACIAAFVIATTTSLFATQAYVKALGLVLGKVTMIAIVGLPSIRGYAYLGMGDSLSYLGMVTELQAGSMSAIDLIYPAIMLISIFLTEILGIDSTDSLMLITPALALLFVLSVPVTVRHVQNSMDLIVISSLSALLLLPVNQVTQAGVFLQPYPTTAALFFLPIVLFSFILFTERGSSEQFVLLMTCCIALLFFHPQQAANLLLFFTALAAFHVSRIISLTERKIDTPLISTSVAFAIVFWLWIATRYQFEQSIAGLVLSIAVDTETTGDVGSVGVSLTELGGSLTELFAKLFLVSLVYCFLTGILVLRVFARHSRRQWLPKFEFSALRRRTLLYLSVGLIPIGILFLLYTVFSSQYFRHLGFIMVVATLLGSFGMLMLYKLTERRTEGSRERVGLAFVFIVMLFLTIPVIHHSPYMYQPTTHVTDGKLSGFETTFAHADPELAYNSIGMSPERASHYALGFPNAVRSSSAETELIERNVTADSDSYLTVTAIGRETHLELYNELRVTSDDFEYLENEPQVNRVYSTSDYDLYYIRSTESSSPT